MLEFDKKKVVSGLKCEMVNGLCVALETPSKSLVSVSQSISSQTNINGSNLVFVK